jgi:hypothetical protein
MLENAVAGLKWRTFTVFAECIRRIEPESFMNIVTTLRPRK